MTRRATRPSCHPSGTPRTGHAASIRAANRYERMTRPAPGATCHRSGLRSQRGSTWKLLVGCAGGLVSADPVELTRAEFLERAVPPGRLGARVDRAETQLAVRARGVGDAEPGVFDASAPGRREVHGLPGQLVQLEH